eukprot:gene4014-5741_t
MKIRYSSDCDILAEKIFTECRFNISASTLRRLFGFVKGTKTVRIQTLDAISNYLGCATWDELIQPLNKESKVTNQKITELKTNRIKVGDKYQYTYKPEAEIIVEYIGKSYFKVISAKNSPLKNDDLFKVGTLALHHPLFISDIERNGETIEKITEAKIKINQIKKQVNLLTQNQSKILTADQLLKEFNISEGTARNWRNSGLAFMKKDRKVYFYREDVERYLSKYSRKGF